MEQSMNEMMSVGKTPVVNKDGNTAGGAQPKSLFQDGTIDDAELLALHEKLKPLAFNQRHIFERQWTRNIWYMLGRHWIEYHNREGQWKDKRLAKWIPRPVTNKCKEVVQAVRAMFTSIQLGVTCRPNGNDPKNISVAATSDELAPLIHMNYNMAKVMQEFDWWLCVTGNAFLYTYWDRDIRYGTVEVKVFECDSCGHRATEDQMDPETDGCPECEVGMMAALPETQRMPKGKGVTDPLSPLELAFPNNYPRFDEVPFVYRLRWRSKSYFEGHSNPAVRAMVGSIGWGKAPQDRSLQIFKSLATQNDLGINPSYWSEGTSSGSEEEGVTEYELWLKPNDQYPQGLVVRFIGEKSPLILHLEEEEAVPGPFPYVDVDGQGLFPFSHAGYEHVGGRILASGVLDPIIQKQDQLNQLDSMIQMIIQRMANPIWLEPKGAEVEKFTGEPGLVVKWNPLTVQGNAKPERIAGEGPHGSLFQIREQYLTDIETLSGTFDIVKGNKPSGVEAFSAIQALIEQSQSRFASVFQSRAEAYAAAFKVQLELVRDFGDEKIVMPVLSPAKKWTYQNFLKADLQGNVTVVVESGTQAPKTNLGKRAAIEHLNSLGFIDPADPDQKYKIFQEFGMTGLSPSLDINVTSALQKQEAFEEWIQDTATVQQWAQEAVVKQQEFDMQQEATMLQYQSTARPDPATGMMPPPPQPATPPSPLEGSPLEWLDWYNPVIHELEFLKWANSDVVREMIAKDQKVKGLLKAHLMEIRIAKQEEMMGVIGGQMLNDAQLSVGATTQQAQGGQAQPQNGSAMQNSNRESTQGNAPGQAEGQRGPA